MEREIYTVRTTGRIPVYYQYAVHNELTTTFFLYCTSVLYLMQISVSASVNLPCLPSLQVPVDPLYLCVKQRVEDGEELLKGNWSLPADRHEARRARRSRRGIEGIESKSRPLFWADQHCFSLLPVNWGAGISYPNIYTA